MEDKKQNEQNKKQNEQNKKKRRQQIITLILALLMLLGPIAYTLATFLMK